MQKNNKVALFDFCETLANFQTADAYVEFVKTHCADHKSEILFREKVYNLLKITRVVSILTRLFPQRSINKRLICFQLRGLNYYDMDRLAKDYYEEIIRPNLIMPVVEELVRLKNEDYRVILVSGGYDIYLKYFAKEFGINEKDVICTQLAFRHYIFLGRYKGKDCLFSEKTRRLDELFNDKEEIYSKAYSDSKSDLPMLQWANEAIVVRREDKKQWNNIYKEIIWKKESLSKI